MRSREKKVNRRGHWRVRRKRFTDGGREKEREGERMREMRRGRGHDKDVL